MRLRRRRFKELVKLVAFAEEFLEGKHTRGILHKPGVKAKLCYSRVTESKVMSDYCNFRSTRTSSA